MSIRNNRRSQQVRGRCPATVNYMAGFKNPVILALYLPGLFPARYLAHSAFGDNRTVRYQRIAIGTRRDHPASGMIQPAHRDIQTTHLFNLGPVQIDSQIFWKALCG